MRHNPTFPPSLNSIPAAAGASAAKRRSKAGLRRASAKPPKAEASQADVETAIAETASKAEWLLFDQSGKRKPYQDFLVLLACRTILRPVPHEPQDDPEALIVRWQEYLFVCDQELVQIFIQAAHGGDEICDRCLCIAASIELQTAKTISDNHLRKYVINKLFGGVVAPTMKKRRGRKSSDNALRNTCIVALLIPPLMPRFSATRNKATTERDSACSIVAKALERVRIHLTEDAVAKVWARVSRLYDTNGVPVGNK